MSRDYPCVGDVVTILEWTSHKDNSWVGECLDVLAVDAPFVCVETSIGPYRLDTRRCTLMRLSADYVAAMRAPRRQNANAFAGLVSDVQVPA